VTQWSVLFVSVCFLFTSGAGAQRLCIRRAWVVSAALPPVVRNGSAFPKLERELWGYAPEAAEPQPLRAFPERQSHSAQHAAKPRRWVPNQSSRQTPAQPVNIEVAQDGTGQFKTVQEAIMSVPAGSADKPVVIHIRPGVYKELIYVQHEKRFFRLVGEDATKTVLTFDLNANLIGPDNKPITTFRTPSTVVDADDFVAENLTFQNSAGPVGQALAIRVDGDRAVFRHCRFRGWQDTLFLNRGRQYFEDCYIEGHVDFIFGAATAFFENCHIHCLRTGYITAASTYDYHPYGFVFSHCKITGEPDVKTYLGRPWRDFANTIYLNTDMSDVVRPEGWQNWNLPVREKTARYGEFNSKGPGANPKARVAWSKQLSSSQAKRITVREVLGGSDKWDPRSVRIIGEPTAQTGVSR
jgi:pectinesterase